MFNRILESLDSPRRHLAFLVSLLVLVFALTGVVAFRALEAERSRSRAVANVIERGLERAAGEWANVYHRGVSSLLNDIAISIVEPMRSSGDISAAAIMARFDAGYRCAVCSNRHSAEAAFDIALPERDIVSATLLPEVTLLERAITALLADTSAIFNDRIHGIAFHGVAQGELETLLLWGIRDPATEVVARVIGISLGSQHALELLQGTFAQAQQVSGSAVVVAQADSLYSPAAFVDDVRVMGEPVGAGSANELRGPIHNLHLAVELRDAYAGGVYDSATKLIAIVGLFVLIGGLLLIAAAQIRREAVLMRLRAEFVSSVSHELRTPLAQIRMFVETLLLGRTRTDLERQRSLEIIEQEARRLSHLVENVLLFSRTEGGRKPRISPEPTDFAGEIRRAVDSFSLLSRAREAEVRTELQENITVQVDRGALRQILVNLIDNALKYGPPAQRITVGAALFDDIARVWVDDEGPGIPEESRTRVFESFYRLSRERQKHVAGSGIGLAVVRELARLHSGEVWAESAPGGGARIVVQFPDAYLRSESADAMAAAS